MMARLAIFAIRLDCVGIPDFVICFLGTAIRRAAGLCWALGEIKLYLLETVGKFNYVERTRRPINVDHVRIYRHP